MVFFWLSEAEANEVVSTYHVTATLACANQRSVWLWDQAEQCCNFEIWAPFNIFKGFYDLSINNLRVFAIFVTLLRYKRPDNFLNYSRLTNLNLVNGIVLSTFSKVDLVEVERPESWVKVDL